MIKCYQTQIVTRRVLLSPEEMLVAEISTPSSSSVITRTIQVNLAIPFALFSPVSIYIIAHSAQVKLVFIKFDSFPEQRGKEKDTSARCVDKEGPQSKMETQPQV